MPVKIKLDGASRTPLYKQLIEQLEAGVRSGQMAPGEMLPSMNELSFRTGISKETVKKAYAILRDKGLVVPKQGKGFFISEEGRSSRPSVLLLFDRLSIYKQLLFNSFCEEIADRAELAILTHNQNLDLFEYYLDNHIDNHDFYIITPHFPLDGKSQARALKLLGRVPNRKLILMDRWMKDLPGKYGAVYQDFENDAYYGLMQGADKLRQCSRLVAVTLPASLYGAQISKAIARAGEELGIPVVFTTGTPGEIRKGDTYLLLNSQLDWGVADLAGRVAKTGLEIGRDVWVISYNEMSLNEVVLGGLTTLSTDFPQMGREAARMILSRTPGKVHCDFRLIRRATF
ncbi:MAG: GntR family transcriptional regulator [Bacteroidales bacterium]|nr:GntR family transcriptional regulator [Bacteroidales bacterium]